MSPQDFHGDQLAEVGAREIDCLVVLLELLLPQELHSVDEKTVDNGDIVLIIKAVNKWLDNQNVHARFSELVYCVRVFYHRQDEPSYPKIISIGYWI